MLAGDLHHGHMTAGPRAATVSAAQDWRLTARFRSPLGHREMNAYAMGKGMPYCWPVLANSTGASILNLPDFLTQARTTHPSRGFWPLPMLPNARSNFERRRQLHARRSADCDRLETCWHFLHAKRSLLGYCSATQRPQRAQLNQALKPPNRHGVRVNRIDWLPSHLRRGRPIVCRSVKRCHALARQSTPGIRCRGSRPRTCGRPCGSRAR